MQHNTNYLINVMGDSDEIRELLGGLPIFKRTSKRLHDLLINYGKVTRLKKGELLIKEGEFDQWVHVLLKGELAVYVGNNLIDHVKGKESLVGERCILGEARKATLKASADDTCSFAVDMAMLDVLEKKTGGNWREVLQTRTELLAVIADAIIHRVVKLAVKQPRVLDEMKRKVKSAFANRLIEAFRSSLLPENGLIDITVYKSLRNEFFEESVAFWNSSTGRPDYSRIFRRLMQPEKTGKLSGIANDVFARIIGLYEQLETEEVASGFITLEQISGGFCEALREAMPKHFGELSDVCDFTAGNDFVCWNLCNHFNSKSEPFPDSLFSTIMDLIELALEFNKKVNGSISLIGQNEKLVRFVNSFFVDQTEEFAESAWLRNLDEKLISPYMERLAGEFGKTRPDEAMTSVAEEEMEVLFERMEGDTRVSNDQMDALFDKIGGNVQIADEEIERPSEADRPAPSNPKEKEE